MAVTQERFEQGMTYEAYKAQMTRNRDRLEATEQSVTLDPEIVEFFAAQESLNVLVLAEDWCGDVLNNLPVLAALAEASGTLTVRIFLRDQNPDLMDLYLNQGQFKSIPVFAFFDGDFTPMGHWIERPEAITAMQAEMVRELYATDPLFEGVMPDTSFALLSDAARTRLGAAFAEFRARTRAQSDLAVQRDLRELVREGASRG